MSPHEKGGENLSRGEISPLENVEKICHVEKFIQMRDVGKILQVKNSPHDEKSVM